MYYGHSKTATFRKALIIEACKRNGVDFETAEDGYYKRLSEQLDGRVGDFNAWAYFTQDVEVYDFKDDEGKRISSVPMALLEMNND